MKINYSKTILKDGTEGIIVILMYSGLGDPKPALNDAVESLTKDNIAYFELIDAHLDNPWVRVLITDINNMTQIDLDPNITLNDLIKNNNDNQDMSVIELVAEIVSKGFKFEKNVFNGKTELVYKIGTYMDDCGNNWNDNIVVDMELSTVSYDMFKKKFKTVEDIIEFKNCVIVLKDGQ